MRMIYCQLVVIFLPFADILGQIDKSGSFLIQGRHMYITLFNNADTTLNLPNAIWEERIDLCYLTRECTSLTLRIEHDYYGMPGTGSHITEYIPGKLAFVKIPPKETQQYEFIIPNIYRKKKHLIKNVFLLFDDGRKLWLVSR